MAAALHPPITPAPMFEKVELGNKALVIFLASLLIFSFTKNLAIEIEFPFQKARAP